MTRLSVHLVRLLTPVPDFEDENVSSTSLLFPKVLFPRELGVVTFFFAPLVCLSDAPSCTVLWMVIQVMAGIRA